MFLIPSRRCLSYALLLGAIASPEFALALTITTEDGQDADSFIFTNQPTKNFGNTTILGVKNDESVFTHGRQTYIRMDLASLSGPITDASLTLTAIATDITFNPPVLYTFDLWGLNDGHTGEWWVEGNGENGVTGATPPSPITWNNAPANDPTNGGLIVGQATLLGGFTISNTLLDGEQVAISTLNLLEFLQSDTNDVVTLIVTRRGITQPSPNVPHRFASKEHSTLAPPTLELTAVPEPSSAVLVATGLAGLAAIGRRRM